MNLQTVLLLSLVAIVTGKFTCSDVDCHECVGDTCHLTCQGDVCRTCPNGNCCNGENCNICHQSICCATSNCNRCVKDNIKLCNEETFPEVCLGRISENCGLQVDEQAFLNNNHNTKFHNVKTSIRLNNVINNTNFINSPIHLNLTHTQNSLMNNTGNSYTKKKKKCCSIVHPQECHKIAGLPREVCFTRKHIECSNLCMNGTNILIRNDSKESKCIIIAAHPYYYCGYYAMEDCSPCYHCSGKRKTECLEEATCSDTCRSSILPKRYYNVPYYIRTSEDSTNTELPPSQ